MTIEDLNRRYENMTADEIISQLEKQYKDDPEAIEAIERAKADLTYIKGQKDYKGQTPKEYALSLAGNLAYWN